MLEQRTERLLATPTAWKMMFVFCTPFLPNTISQQTQTYIKGTDLNHPTPTHTWHLEKNSTNLSASKSQTDPFRRGGDPFVSIWAAANAPNPYFNTKHRIIIHPSTHQSLSPSKHQNHLNPPTCWPADRSKLNQQSIVPNLVDRIALIGDCFHLEGNQHVP